MTRKSKNVNVNSTTACPEESVKLVKRFRPKEQLIVEFKEETRTDPWGPLFLLPLKQTMENPIQTKKINHPLHNWKFTRKSSNQNYQWSKQGATTSADTNAHESRQEC
jgi:hypothetical protein